MGSLSEMSSAGNEASATDDIVRVVEGGYCIGCGACAYAAPAAAEMVESKYGMPVARIRAEATPAHRALATSVCPFGTPVEDETSLGERLFGAAVPMHEELGRVVSTHAAQVVEGAFRENGSSGGMGSWLAVEFLRAGLADAVVHVGAITGAQAGEPLFEYAISRSQRDVLSRAKSRYYPITLTQVLAEVRATEGRYVFVGIPCVLKALRLVAMKDEVIRSRIALCIGLVCGHLKTRRFAELLAWQMGVPPKELLAFDFRHKLPGAQANQYGVAATRAPAAVGSTQPVISPVRELFGYDWGLGFFKPKSCDFCDDVVAELADVTIGDAWLPQYVKDSKGTNVVIVRNPVVRSLVERAAAEGRLVLDALSAADVVKSQASGFSHRREGLAYRLWMTRKRGEWAPRKRVEPAAFEHDRSFRRKHELRAAVARESHRAFAEARDAGQLRIFFKRMTPIVERYRDLNRTLARRVAARLRRWLHAASGK